MYVDTIDLEFRETVSGNTSAPGAYYRVMYVWTAT